MQPDISLIIPVFNNEQFVDETLSAARAQAGVSLEIIVIDDGSTDTSLDLIKAHAAQDPRIIVIAQVNQGVSAARNAGLDRATGRWLAFLDGDDWIAPGALADWHQQAEQGQLDCLLCNAFTFTAELTQAYCAGVFIILKRQPWDSTMSGAEWIVESVKQREWPHYVWMQFCRRSVIEESHLRFRRDMIHEDIPWTVQLALAANKMGFSQPPKYGYRRNPTSLTQSRSVDKVIHRIASYLKVTRLLKEFAHGQPSPVRKALLKQVQREMGHFLGLMRKGNIPRADRRQFAAEFLSSGCAWLMLQGSSNFRELVAVFKAWYLCQIWQRQGG